MYTTTIVNLERRQTMWVLSYRLFHFGNDLQNHLRKN